MGKKKYCNWGEKEENTVFPHIRPAGINFSLGLQVRVLLEITKFHLHKSVPTAGIIRVAGIFRGRALYEEIWYVQPASNMGGLVIH